MIVKSSMVIFILCFALISDVIGASYSSVYVGNDVIPVEYAPYGAPYTSILNTRLSQINSLPPASGLVSPCGLPCVYPSQTIATVTPVVNPNANILNYKTAVPGVPIVVTPPNEETAGYEYSYVVYDENTGDHKAQRELSDGSVVRGEYSFLQPDGYVREVQYVADDVSGFNAVVKNFLPVAVEGKRKVEANGKKETSPPCPDVKNASLKEKSLEEIDKSSEKQEFKQNKEESKSEEIKDSDEQSKEKLKSEPNIESQKVIEEEKSADKPDNEAVPSKEVSKEDSGEKSKEYQEKTEELEVETKEETKEKQNIQIKEETSQDTKDKLSKEESGEKSNVEKNKNNKSESREDSVSGEVVNEELRESKENDKNKFKNGSKESSESEESYERLNLGKNKEAHELLLQPEREVQVPYKDILRCIQAAIKRANGVPSAYREEASPLTYIILNKPC